MHRYLLRAVDPLGNRVAEIEFECLSIAGALDRAKRKLQGIRADLFEDGRPICSMELVADTGAWLIGGPKPDAVGEQQPVSCATWDSDSPRSSRSLAAEIAQTQDASWSNR